MNKRGEMAYMDSARRAQAIVEYAIVLAIITAAVTGMSVYAKRSIQGSIKAASDQIGDQTEGIRYESGDHRQEGETSSDSGVLIRRSESVTVKDTVIQNLELPGGARKKITFAQDSLTVGSPYLKDECEANGLASCKNGLSSYSKSISQ